MNKAVRDDRAYGKSGLSVSREETDRLFTMSKNLDGSELVREFLAGVDDPVAWYNELVCEAQYAWKLFLDLRPESIILDMSCGFGGLASAVESHVGQVISIDSDSRRLEFSKTRGTRQDDRRSVFFIQAHSEGGLPFSTACFDFVFLSGTSADIALRDKRSRTLHEVRRVLKSSGRLFIGAENPWSYVKRHGSVLELNPWNIRSRLRKSGFVTVDVLGFAHSLNWPEEIFQTDIDIPYWRKPQNITIADKVKHSSFFIPAFGLIAGSNSMGVARLLDGLVGEVARSLDRSGGDFEISDFKVSQKNKVICRAAFNKRAIYLRVPMSVAASVSEKNNRLITEFVDSDRSLADSVPVPLAYGHYGQSKFFVESAVSGTPVREVGTGIDWHSHVTDVAGFLYRLNPEGLEEAELSGGLYEKFVSNRLAQLAALVSQSDFEIMQTFFREKIYDMTVFAGLSHGDFGVSNLRLDSNGLICGLIDWEYGQINGLPVLDAINYVCSFYQMKNREIGFSECLWNITFNWQPDSDQYLLIKKYFDFYGIEADGFGMLPYLWWLHVVSCRLDNGMEYKPDEIQKFVSSVLAKGFFRS